MGAMNARWFSDDEPFLRPNEPSYPAAMTDAAVRLLADRGVDGLSVGALARALGVTPQAVLKDWPRARVVELLCVHFADRWLTWTGPDRMAELPCRLPRNEAERHGVRVHRALLELARGELARGRPGPAAVWADTAAQERVRLAATLSRTAGRAVGDDDVARIHALTAGLRLALADPGAHLAWESAAELLRDQAAQLVVDNQRRAEGQVR